MNKLIAHGERSGSVRAIASKSVAHRALICAALSKEKRSIRIDDISEDINATIDCLNAMGAGITIAQNTLHITPVNKNKAGNPSVFLCKESGSTLRFLLPVTGALGTEGTFILEGRLAERPQQKFIDLLNDHGMKIETANNRIHCKGQLKAGDFNLPGNISSQYISGLLFALPLLDSESSICIEGDIQSKDYIKLTEQALNTAKIKFEKIDKNRYLVFGDQKYDYENEISVEGDWSNAALFLCMGALSGQGIRVSGLDTASYQGDKKVLDILESFGADLKVSDEDIEIKRGDLKGIDIDASDIPDIIPALSVVASAAKGVTKIYNAGRLRLKESDRLKGTAGILSSLGADITEAQDGLIICGQTKLKGGKVDPLGDHRMAMMAALASCISGADVEVENAECVNKSYPDFWKDLEGLKISGQQ